VRFLTNGNFYSSCIWGWCNSQIRSDPAERDRDIHFVSGFRFRCLLHMERELQMLAQQSRASAFPSTKPRVRSRLESSSSLSFPRLFSSSRKKTRFVERSHCISFYLRLLASSACPRFDRGNWMLLMESSNGSGAMEGARDAGHINSMVIKTTSLMA